MKSNVVLIGMPGCGKSTCGVLTAKALLKNFFDTDLLIQNNENSTLQNILDEKGSEYFKKAEEDAILSLNIRGTVIATGGSVVYSEKAMEHLREIGDVVYLHLSYETMEKRINNITTRGVVLGENKTLKDMYNERLDLYNKYADKIVYCDDLSVEETVEKIVELSNS